MGEYAAATESFKAARKLAPADQAKTFDRHIQETQVTQQIAQSESALDEAVRATGGGGGGDGADRGGGGDSGDSGGGGGDGATFKAIERGASKLSLPALKPVEYLATAGDLLRTITFVTMSSLAQLFAHAWLHWPYHHRVNDCIGPTIIPLALLS
jgi:hypothetical protein